jgi:Carboxypeptidase regulatory-like domain/TonB dependent receptor-like, beta-barrel
MKRLMICSLLCMFLAFGFAGFAAAQTTGGTLRGTVTDSQGLAIASAMVNITNNDTKVTIPLSTTASGLYNYPDLIVGTYSITVEKDGFQKVVRSGIQLFANQVTEVNVSLPLGSVTSTIEVTGATPLVQTGTSQISNDFTAMQVTQLPNPDPSGSQLQLALLAPGTTAQGAGVLGEGGSIGGTRPRFNSFTIDGVDDNRIDVTGHTQYVIPESVAEFNLLTNQFSAEYGHSAGGQFNTITKSGTDSWHGGAWELNNNRHYNAYDNLEKTPVNGVIPPIPRSDFNRFGVDIGGPIIHNKLFIYGAFQRIVQGLSTQAVIQSAPTTAGLATLKSASDTAVQDILDQFPTAGTQSSTCSATGTGSGNLPCFETITVPSTACAGGCSVPFGDISPLAPNFFNQWDFIINADATLGKHSLAFHVLYDRGRQPNVNGDTPQAQFTGSIASDTRKYLFKDTWVISSRFVNEFRAGYSRLVNDFGVPTTFDNFPNAEVDTLGINVGPQGCSPQGTILNTYQFVDNMSFVVGKHNLKWGVEWTHAIAPTDFLARARGEWDYANLNELANDAIPTGFNGALRGAGSGLFRGNQNGAAGFIQDDWKILPRLTLNLGLRYEWNGVPKDDNLQNLNAISNLPGAFVFGTPKGDYNNIGPRVGLAWDPTGNGKWAVRAGFGISYDQIPQNFVTLSLPPQLYTEQNPAVTCGLPGAPAWCPAGPGFLQNGGLLQVNVPCSTVSDCRLSTSALIVDVVEPKVMTWSLGVQHEIGWNSSVEVRYVGTRSLELPIQARLNTQTGFAAGLGAIPTYLSASSVPATVATPGVTLADWDTFENNAGGGPGGSCLAPSPFIYGVQGFCGALITGFPPSANGIYQGISLDFNHRVGHGLTLRSNYTYSKNMDDATNELFSSRVNPRRPQDWQNLSNDWGRSTLDVPSKFTVSWVYDLPGWHGDSSLLRGFSNGWQYQGSWQVYNGTPVTIANGADVNGNFDSAGDRPVLNPGATGNGVSQIDYACNAGAGGAVSIVSDPATCGTGDDSNIVGYVAQDPTARFVSAGLGALSTVRRNGFRSPGINMWNMGIQKDTKITERVHIAFSLSAYDVFNHRNFSLAQPDVLEAGSGSFINNTNNSLSTTYTNINAAGAGFLDKTQFSGGSRKVQLGVTLSF